IKGPAVHGGADVAHIAVGRDDDGTQPGPQLAQVRQQRQAVHDRHVDVAEDEVDGGVAENAERLLAIAGEDEVVGPLTELAAEALTEQYFQVRLIVYNQDLRHEKSDPGPAGGESAAHLAGPADPLQGLYGPRTSVKEMPREGRGSPFGLSVGRGRFSGWLP